MSSAPTAPLPTCAACGVTLTMDSAYVAQGSRGRHVVCVRHAEVLRGQGWPVEPPTAITQENINDIR